MFFSEFTMSQAVVPISVGTENFAEGVLSAAHDHADQFLNFGTHEQTLMVEIITPDHPTSPPPTK